MLLKILLHTFLFIEFSHQINEECLCIDMKRHEIHEKEIIPLTTFLTADFNIRFQIAFENKDGVLDMDYIKVKPDSYEIKRKRNRVESVEKNNVSIPLGWVHMNITMDKNIFSIDPFNVKMIPDFPMQHLTIASQFMSSCKQGTPSWKIVRDQAVTLPLNGLGRNRISFTSEKDFSPFISINSFDLHLTYDSGVFLKTSGKKLPTNIYELIVENEKDMLRLLYQEEGCDVYSLASLKVKTVLENITVGTVDEDFTLILEPREHQTRKCENISTTTESLGGLAGQTQHVQPRDAPIGTDNGSTLNLSEYLSLL
ncbi:unnamed protein product [Meganyctiphanes norvegica]|uniref:Uncharacterized protein n=1 Tax=Meganyctiphanes norvegica TaxID=48144 RepID=A0AAV2R310_MEGNR